MAGKGEYPSFGKDYMRAVVRAPEYNTVVKRHHRHFVPLQTGIMDFATLAAPRYEAMRLRLGEIEKHAKTLSGIAEVKKSSLGKPLDTLLKEARRTKAEVAKRERVYETSAEALGLVEVDVCIEVNDYHDRQVGDATLRLEIDAAPRNAVLTTKLSNGSARFRGVMVEPSGTAYVEIGLRRKTMRKISQNLGYRGLKPGGILMIDARERPRTQTVKAESGAAVVDRLGLKGTLGIDYSIVSLGGEITRESELETTMKKTVEYTVHCPSGVLVLKQT